MKETLLVCLVVILVVSAVTIPGDLPNLLNEKGRYILSTNSAKIHSIQRMNGEGDGGENF